jgi:tetratricopeptide (TPR) repeat protein
LALCVVASAGRACADAAAKPLEPAELLALVAGNALPENVVHDIATDGIAFRPDDTYRTLLKNAGADARILQALDSAKAAIAGRSVAGNQDLLRHLSDAGKQIRAKEYPDAARELSAVLQASFRSPEAGFVMGEVLRETQQWEQAESVYDAVLQQWPDFPEAHTKLSYILFHVGDQEGALRQAKTALALNPSDAEAHRNAGVALDAMRKYDASFAEYNEALRLKPDYEVAYYDLGVSFGEQGKLKEALVEYRKALSVDPNDTDALYNLAFTLHDSGDRAGAIREYREVERINPQRYDARQNLGAALMENRDYPEAVKELRALEQLYPDAEMCRVALGQALFGTWDLAGAEKEYEKAIELDPTDAMPHANLGDVFDEKKSYDEALAQYSKAKEMDPTLIDSYRGAGRVLMKKGDFAGAVSWLQQGENVAPADANIHDLYGQALEGAGNLDPAIGEFRQSLALGAKQMQVMLRLAAALERKGDWAAAIEEYRHAALADSGVEFRDRIRRGDDRDPQREYKDAQKRLDDHLAALKAAGQTREADDLARRVDATEASSGISDQLNAAMRDGWAADQKRNFDEARRDFKTAVDLAEKIQPHDQRLVTALDLYGKNCMGQDWPAAQAALERELQAAVALYGPESQAAAEAQQSLGLDALAQKDYASAEKHFFQAVDIDEKTFGEGSDKVASSLVTAVGAYIPQKEYAKAEPFLLRAERIDESLYGADNIGMLIPLSALCGLYDRWEKPDQSLVWDQRLLTVLGKQYGKNSPVLVTTLDSESKALRGLGRGKEADKVDQQIASIRAATMAPATTASSAGPTN